MARPAGHSTGPSLVLRRRMVPSRRRRWRGCPSTGGHSQISWLTVQGTFRSAPLPGAGSLVSPLPLLQLFSKESSSSSRAMALRPPGTSPLRRAALICQSPGGLCPSQRAARTGKSLGNLVCFTCQLFKQDSDLSDRKIKPSKPSLSHMAGEQRDAPMESTPCCLWCRSSTQLRVKPRLLMPEAQCPPLTL